MGRRWRPGHAHALRGKTAEGAILHASRMHLVRTPQTPPAAANNNTRGTPLPVGATSQRTGDQQRTHKQPWWGRREQWSCMPSTRTPDLFECEAMRILKHCSDKLSQKFQQTLQQRPCSAWQCSFLIQSGRGCVPRPTSHGLACPITPWAPLPPMPMPVPPLGK